MLKLNRLKRARGILVLWALIVLAGCSAQPEKKASLFSLTSEPTYIRSGMKEDEPPVAGADGDTVPVNPDEPLYSTQLRLPQQKGISLGGSGVYWGNPQQPVAANFIFENATLNKRHLTIMCLVDYAQVPCQSTNSALTETVLSGKRAVIPLLFPALPPGKHYLAAMAFSYLPVAEQIIQQPKDFGEFVMESPNYFWSVDVTYFAGAAEEPTYAPTEFALQPATGNVQGALHFFVTTIANQNNGEGYPLPNLNTDFTGKLLKVKPGEKIALYLHGEGTKDALFFQLNQRLQVGKPADQLPFVIATFLDTQQVAVDGSGAAAPLYGSVPLGKEVLIPVTSSAPNEAGIHSYTVVYEAGPFMPSGELVAQPDGGVLYKLVASLPLVICERVVFEIVP